MRRMISSRRQKIVADLYEELLAEHGPQGWWPVQCECPHGYYHPNTYNIPQTRNGRFEVSVGAVLTQNTAWTNVEKALKSLGASGMLEPNALRACALDSLESMIRPAGYFRQKARYLHALSEWFLQVDSAWEKGIPPARETLLSCRGVGPETADSILLYAYFQPTFVVDAYTRRIFTERKVIDSSWPYHEIQELFHQSLARDVRIFQEYHALIVAHAKIYHSKKSPRVSVA